MNIDDRIGEQGKWKLPVDGGFEEVDGTYLGMSSSRSPRHFTRSHPDGIDKPPSKGARCSACRWSEFRIFREEENGTPISRPYLVHITGGSVVPGETSRCRIEDMLTGPEVIEILTTRRDRMAYLSVPAGDVLAQAAGIDRGELLRAYDARKVA